MSLAGYVLSAFIGAANPVDTPPALPPVSTINRYYLGSRGSRLPDRNLGKTRRQRREAKGFNGWHGPAYVF